MHSSMNDQYNHLYPPQYQQQERNFHRVASSNNNCYDEVMQQQRSKPSQLGSSFTTNTSSYKQKNKNSCNVNVKYTSKKPSMTLSVNTSNSCINHNNTNNNSPPPLNSASTTMDDFDIMLLHEDFPHLLMIASQVKKTQWKIANKLNNSTVDSGMFTTPSNTYDTYRPKHAMLPEEVLLAVDRMQEVLINRKRSNDDNATSTIPRGRYPITDSLMEDAMIALQQEYDFGQQWLIDNDHCDRATIQDSSSNDMPSSSTSTLYNTTNHNKRGRYDVVSSTESASGGSCNGAAATSAPITVKYAKWQTDALMNWMIDNKDQPFPDADAIEMLIEQTGLTNSQIVNWTTNVRKRNRKATCENGKKPHHFLDFLFLVHDRECKKATAVTASTVDEIESEYDQQEEEKYQIKYGESPKMRNTTGTQNNVPKPSPPTKSCDYIHIPDEVHVSRQEKYFQGELVSRNLSNMQFGIGHNTTSNMTRFIGTHVQHEPIPLLVQSNDDILVDFADCWLMDHPMNTNNHNYVVSHQHPYGQGFVPLTRDNSNILPSVTDDSHDVCMDRNVSPTFSLGSFNDSDNDDDDMMLIQDIINGDDLFSD
jgi:hypothetical protein